MGEINFSNLKMHSVDTPVLGAIYGPPGIGKTALTAGADEKSHYLTGREDHLILNIDHRGSDRLVCNRASDLIGKPITGTEDIENIFDALITQDNPFKWVGVDDLSTLEDIFVSEICAEYKVDKLDAINYGKGYELAKTQWLKFFRILKYVQETKQINIILLGHTKIESIKDPLMDAYSRHDLQLDKRSKDIIKKAVDFIGFAHKKVMTKEVDSNFGKKEVKAVGNSQRILSFSPDIEGFESKDRLGMPSEMALDWSIFETELKTALKNKSNNKTTKGEKE